MVVIAVMVVVRRRSHRQPVYDAEKSMDSTPQYANPLYYGSRSSAGTIDFLQSSAQMDQEATQGETNFNGRHFLDDMHMDF